MVCMVMVSSDQLRARTVCVCCDVVWHCLGLTRATPATGTARKSGYHSRGGELCTMHDVRDVLKHTVIVLVLLPGPQVTALQEELDYTHAHYQKIIESVAGPGGCG